MVKEIPLTKGMVALVDDEDYPALSKHKWYAHPNRNGIFYARCGIYDPATQKQKQVFMHRMLCAGEQVDHKDRNTLNNQRGNLSSSTQAQNQHNKNYANVHGYKGIFSNKGRFTARIQINGKRISLGTFDTPEQAHAALVAYRNGIAFMWPEVEP